MPFRQSIIEGSIVAKSVHSISIDEGLGPQQILASADQPEVSIVIQPLKLFLRPKCILQAMHMFSASEVPDSLHSRRRASMLKLSSKDRLRAQSEDLPRVDAPLRVSFQASHITTHRIFPVLYFAYLYL